MHGQAYFNINNSVLNTSNPFTSQEPGYQSDMFNVARNLFKRVNLAPPMGNLNSPFGQSIALAGGAFGTSAANRRIDFQILFGF